MTTELNSYPTPNPNIYNGTTRNGSTPYGSPNLTLETGQLPTVVHWARYSAGYESL